MHHVTLRPWCVDWPSEQDGDSWLDDIVSEDKDFGGIAFPKKPPPGQKSSDT